MPSPKIRWGSEGTVYLELRLGVFVALLGLTTDLSERKRAKKFLRLLRGMKALPQLFYPTSISSDYSPLTVSGSLAPGFCLGRWGMALFTFRFLET